MKKIIFLIILLSLGSCTYLNESKIIEKNIDINTFLWEENNNPKYLSGSLESELEQIQNLEIKLDDIMDDDLKNEENASEEVSEQEINELIDILFETN